jgi:hypothetical protein
MKWVFCLLAALAVLAIALSGCGGQEITKEQAVTLAREHLQKYGHHPPVVERVEVEEGELKACTKKGHQSPSETGREDARGIFTTKGQPCGPGQLFPQLPERHDSRAISWARSSSWSLPFCTR